MKNLTLKLTIRHLFTLFWACSLVLISLPGSAQNVAINRDGSTPDVSALLDLTATDAGMLTPRMSTAQRNAISSPANGLLVYDTDMELFYYNLGTPGSTIWVPISSGWHSDKTRIKILPRDFMITSEDDEGEPKAEEWSYDDITNGSTTNNGVNMGDSNVDLVAFVNIPTGYKATHVRIYGNDTGRTFDVYESSIITGNLTSKGSANVGSEANITDVSSSNTNFLVIFIRFDTKSYDKAYGGYVTIAPL